jgi:hypothetical protein
MERNDENPDILARNNFTYFTVEHASLLTSTDKRNSE